MREQVEQIAVSLSVVNPVSGEIFPVTGNHTTTSRYYSIKNLNFKGSIMDLFTYQEQLCKSSKDIGMFRDILFRVNKYNELRYNISELSKEINISRQRLTKFLNDSVQIGFMKRIERGVYAVHPRAFRSKGSTNEIIEKAQLDWEFLKEV